MTRPTKEEVDEAFEKLETKRFAGRETFVEDVLCREVIALRRRLAAHTERGRALTVDRDMWHDRATAPRYSTEEVSAAFVMYDRHCLHDMNADEFDLDQALEAARASRKPKL